MSMVEDGAVERAMYDFYQVLKIYRVGTPDAQQALRGDAYCLAHRMRSSIEDSWSIQLQNREPPSAPPHFPKFAEIVKDPCLAGFGDRSAYVKRLKQQEDQAALKQ
jgi:hypothetical protein